MTTFADPVATDFVRDQWMRPLVVPVGGGRPIPYTRASAAAKTVEDTYQLELWARRNIVFGMSRDPSLIARTIALGGDPSLQRAKRAAGYVLAIECDRVISARRRRRPLPAAP